MVDEARADYRDAERWHRFAQGMGRIRHLEAIRANGKGSRHWKNSRGFRLLCRNWIPGGGLRGRIRQHGRRKDQAQHSTDGENANPRSRGRVDRCCRWVGWTNRESWCSKTCLLARRQRTAQAQTRTSEEQKHISISIDAHASWRQFSGYLLRREWSILSHRWVLHQCLVPRRVPSRHLRQTTKRRIIPGCKC